jgi:hypothetical protein
MRSVGAFEQSTVFGSEAILELMTSTTAHASIVCNSCTPSQRGARQLLALGADASLRTQDDFSAVDMAASVECLRLLRPARQPIPSESPP